MKAKTPFDYGYEGKQGFYHDQMQELLKAFDLNYDPDMNDFDLIKISSIERDTLSLQSC